ncbi:MAG: hypothetical protein ABEL76_10655 [Bradymonadaceae bacterium]
MTDGRPDIDFPELCQSTLGDETLAKYFDDLEQVADIREIRVKAAARARADEKPTDLKDARRLLRSGEVRGIQLRYVWQQEAWWDTLMQTPEGVQITRVQPPAVEELD